MSESENIRPSSGIEINGIPSADQIIELGRNNPCVYAALSCWRKGDMTFDEALRMAVWHLVDANDRLHRMATDLASLVLSDKIIVEHPSKK